MTHPDEWMNWMTIYRMGTLFVSMGINISNTGIQ